MTELFYLSSPIGFLKVTVKEAKLYSISQKKLIKSKGILNQQTKVCDSASLSHVAVDIKKQLEKYFKGRLKTFCIPLFDRGTEFQKKVWAKLQTIPWGQTTTYSELALTLQNKKAYRAVGSACANNPFLIVVPCHRVLSQKGLGGFALGLKAKQALLFLEKQSLKKSVV